MNFAAAQARHDNMLPRDNDTSASEAHDAFRADQVRTSLDPMDRLIVNIIERDSFDPDNGIQHRSVELQDALIVRAAEIKAKRWDDHAWWDEATNDAMCLDTPDKLAILDLCASGEDDCQLGNLFRTITRQAFAEACVNAAEGELAS